VFWDEPCILMLRVTVTVGMKRKFEMFYIKK